MNNDDDVRRWVVKMLGSERFFVGAFGDVWDKSRMGETGPLRASDADLAEALRVWWLAYSTPLPSLSMREFAAGQAWGFDGPLAFMRAVKETVDGR